MIINWWCFRLKILDGHWNFFRKKTIFFFFLKSNVKMFEFWEISVKFSHFALPKTFHCYELNSVHNQNNPQNIISSENSSLKIILNTSPHCISNNELCQVCVCVRCVCFNIIIIITFVINSWPSYRFLIL